jgi:hypothetical protein
VALAAGSIPSRTSSQRPIAASSADKDTTGGDAESPPIVPNKLLPLSLPTFEGSGQVVHPDVILLPHDWPNATARLAMAITPYPYGDARQEDPSIFFSEQGKTWTAPTETRNPVVRPADDGYLSDPALVFDNSADVLRMYYREVGNADNVIRFVATRDGVHWSTPRETIRVAAHRLLSPSVVRRSTNHWLMWSINAGARGCSSSYTNVNLRRSNDGVHWSAPRRVQIDTRRGYPWHIDVKWIGQLHEYWALYNLKPSGTCVTPAVYLATSNDGRRWKTYSRPVLERGAIPAFADIVYRSSFVYTKADDMVTFYFSGARRDGKRYVWSGAIERRSRASLFADLERPGTAGLARAQHELASPERFPEASRQQRHHA